MASKEYNEDEIIHLDFDDGEGFDCGIIGVFAVDGKDYIALEALDGSDDVYLYGYKENGEDFDLEDIEDQEVRKMVVLQTVSSY